ncbi:MAG: flagellar hook-length control protein FliK [Candidatus Eremiobacteraeota bacterium]|nr:flagellar hook-length control protein FliK [Candidatus Eremiobacteraeota bacterium]
MFKAQLGDSIGKLFTGKRSTDVPASSVKALPADAAPAAAELAQAIKEQLDNGASLDDVIAKLASSLATSVAAALGIPVDAAREQLTQVFTKALQPTDTGPPRSNAERASSLVTRLRQIAELATGVTNGDTGHTIRLIVGQRSDAEQAKAGPTPPPDSILADALAALAAPASPAPGATTVASVSPAAPAASDGRTVALESPAQAVAAGGDTPLGRIVARALLAGDQNGSAAPVTPVSGPFQSGAFHRLDGSPRDVVTSADGLASVSGASAPAGSRSVLDAFVQAFAAALARADAPGSGRGNSAISPPPVLPEATAVAASSAAPAQPALAFAIPFVHDAPAVAPPAPAQTMPQPQHVDANAVVDQILRGMTIRTTDGQSEVRLRLVPENLGDVSVKLTVTGGLVDASITAHSADAQNALAGGQNQLAKTLADAGLKLQSFTVGLAGGGFADARDQSRPRDSWNRPGSRRFGGVESVDFDESGDASLLANSSFGPPIYSARSLPGTLNRLA